MNDIQIYNKPLTAAETKRTQKREWQRNNRRKFQERYGFSSAANYSNGGLRLKVLQRDNFACVKCGMTDSEHKANWGRPITVDHIDRDRKNNTMENLMTLCLSCHGRKDQAWYLRLQRGPVHKQEIISMRKAGKTYQQIAGELDMSISTVWSWFKKWEREGLV